MLRRLMTSVVCAFSLVAVVAPTVDAAQIVYQRQGSPINGRVRGECGYQCVSSWYRAGSGNGGTNACAYGNWTPVGTYNVWFHSDGYDANLIKGRVWRMDNYHCSNGVVRTELFVHTEETASRAQSCPTAGDDPFCWEDTNDYYSLGCVKVARMPIGGDGSSDMGRLDSYIHSVGGAAHVIVQS